MERTSFSILFYIKKSKAKILKNGEAPIYVKLTINRRSCEFALKRSVIPKLWDTSKNKVRGRNKSHLEINQLIEEIRFKAKYFQNELIKEGKTVTPANIKNKIFGIKKNDSTLIELITEHNKVAESLLGIDYVQGTIQKFKAGLNKIKCYLNEELRLNDIPIRDLDHTFIVGFEGYLKRNGCSHNSAMKYLKFLKKITNAAIANNLISNDPFYTYQISIKKVHREVLSDSELRTLMNKPISINRLSEVRDVFVFQCLTGLSYNDLKKLNRRDIEQHIDGTKQINIRRTKTNEPCIITLINPALDILNKYENNPKCIKDDVLLPVISNQNMNAYLKEIAVICDISKKLTTHIARHTFATTIGLANNVPIEVISRILGHSKLQTTQIYAKVDSRLVKEEFSKIEKKIAGL